MKVKDEIARAWAASQSFYRAFRARIDSSSSSSSNPPSFTSETRNLWLAPLLSLLGYKPEFTRRGEEVGGKSYPISHRAEGHDGLPIHLLGWGDPLDRRRDDGYGPRMSPHALLQEYLNLTEHLYGLVSNGRVLRLLRDSTRLVRQSFIEFDLERMFDEDLFADFAILFRLLHSTRLPASQAAAPSSLVERYHQDALDQGSRIRDGLRAAVEQALVLLGNGFLEDDQVQKLFSGAEPLTPKEYYHQLLRLVYRLLFLLVAEERGLIHPANAKPRERTIYTRHYAVSRLRRLALRAHLVEKRHADLWQGLLHTFRLFEFDGPGVKLGIAPLGGALFSANALGPLGAARLSNAILLQVMERLCFFTAENGAKTAVNYGALATEEFGSVYESLLELNPVVDGRTFQFRKAAGNERKTSGSYYTPDSLVQCLLDSALEPVVEEAIRGKGPEDAAEALLKLKVCDPAAGSGHFVLGVAHRLARHLAQVRARGDEPSPASYRTALRHVIGRCIYAVDINPMAVELCKINLWLEAMEPGKPLTFLDHHIQCGNALLGASPGLMARGIPDEAFEAIEGDDKRYCSQFRKQNKQERTGQISLFGSDLKPWDRIGNFASAMMNVDDLPDDTPEAVRTKEQRYAELVCSGSYEIGRQLADAWCAAFVWKKCPPAAGGFDFPITHELFIRLEQNPQDAPKWMRDEIRRLAGEYQFFHWHLAFPEVFQPLVTIEKGDPKGWKGGFDLVLGNPPWDTLSPDQREFFEQYHPGMRSLGPKEQESVLAPLLAEPAIAAAWAKHCRDLFATVHFLKDAGRFTLYASGNLGKGDFNVYRMFVELALRTTRIRGFAAQIVPAGFYGGANASAIRHCIFDENRLDLLMGCENKGQSFFPGVHPQTWFALYVVERGGRTEHFRLAFGVDNPAAAGSAVQQAMRMDASLIREQAADTYAIPDVRNETELITSRKMYAACPAFGDEFAGPPIRHYQAELHMGNDRGLFTDDPAGLPVYEGRMIDHFDHRAKTYESGHGNSAVWIERPFGDPAKRIVPQWRVLRKDIPAKLGDRVDRYRVGFGDVANPRNERSFVASLIPPGTICGDKVPTIVFDRQHDWAFLPWLAVANSFAMDWLARAKIASLKMSYTIMNGLPFPRPTLADSFVQRVAPLVLRLICTAPEMTAYWNAMAKLGLCEPVPDGTVPPDALTTPEPRAQARAQLDAIVARDVFGLTRQELSDILDTFPVMKRRDEKQFGSFRTKEAILSAYDSDAVRGHAIISPESTAEASLSHLTSVHSRHRRGGSSCP